MRQLLFILAVSVLACTFARTQEQPSTVDLTALSRPLPLHGIALTALPTPPPLAVIETPAETKPKKVVDGKFIFLGVMTMLSTAADIEFTQHCLKEKTCHELNPTLPLSRWGMYATNTPVNLAVMYWSYRRKRDGKFGWWLPMTIDVGIHGGGLATNVRFAF
jgi:hypothetical protein